MKNTTHSQERWEISPRYSPNQDEYREIISGGKIIARVHNNNFQMAIDKVEAESNIKLMVEAPNLLNEMDQVNHYAKTALESLDKNNLSEVRGMLEGIIKKSNLIITKITE